MVGTARTGDGVRGALDDWLGARARRVSYFPAQQAWRKSCVISAGRDQKRPVRTVIVTLGAVTTRRNPQGSLFEPLFPENPRALYEPWILHADRLLDDDELLDTLYDALGRRRPRSCRHGRPCTTAEVVLRLLVLKHVRDWAFDCSSARSASTSSIARSPASAATPCRTPRPWRASPARSAPQSSPSRTSA